MGICWKRVRRFWVLFIFISLGVCLKELGREFSFWRIRFLFGFGGLGGERKIERVILD